MAPPSSTLTATAGPRPAAAGLPAATPPADEGLPIFVDLDGTLVTSDTLLEGTLTLTRHRPLDLLRFPAWLARGRAFFKARIAERVKLDVSRLPYRAELCDYLRAARRAGRRVYLATAADQALARRIADHLGLFDGVVASDGRRNLKAEHKLAAITALAPGGFVYAGNARADLVIWRAARQAIMVGAPPSVLRAALATSHVAHVLPRDASPLREGARAMRLPQWAKNLLVFVPLLTSFRFVELAAVLHALAAFVAFSLCASAVYIVNDLLDLDADRAHPRKRLRPFAAGTLPITTGLLLSGVCLLAGLAAAIGGSEALFGIMLAYLVATTAYSFHLKTRVFLDVLVLALLYTLRIWGGSVGSGIPLSQWLLVLSLFVFLSLGLIKRCSELLVVKREGRSGLRGRDYDLDDLSVFWPMGVATLVGSILVFALYIRSADVAANYHQPALLWLVALGLFYWLGRMWVKTARGEMTDDPLVFTFRDFGSRIVIAAMLVLTLLAHFLPAS